MSDISIRERAHVPALNVSLRKVGGIWFLRLGRIQFSFCLCRA